MQVLLNLLAGVALLVWGTHIVRASILRLYGGDLRRVLRQSVSEPLRRICRRARRHRADPEQHRDRADRRRVRRSGPDRHRARAGGDAGRRRRHQPDGPGVLVRSFLAVAAADLHRRAALPDARKRQGRTLRPHPDRAGPDHHGAAADRLGGEAADPGRRRPGHLRLADRRRPAGHAGRGDVLDSRVLEPRCRAADRGAGRFEGDRHPCGDGAGPRRQPGQRRAGDAQHDALGARGAARDLGQLPVQADRLPGDRAAAGLYRTAAGFARSGREPDGRAFPSAVQRDDRRRLPVLHRKDCAARRASDAGQARHRRSGRSRAISIRRR